MLSRPVTALLVQRFEQSVDPLGLRGVGHLAKTQMTIQGAAHSVRKASAVHRGRALAVGSGDEVGLSLQATLPVRASAFHTAVDPTSRRIDQFLGDPVLEYFA